MKVMDQRPNQQDPGIFHVNAVYVRVQSGSKINAVGSDSGLISSGLSRVGFIFFIIIYARQVRVRSDFRTREDL